MLYNAPELDQRELEVVAEIDTIRDELSSQIAHPNQWFAHLRRATMARNVQAARAIDPKATGVEDAAVAVLSGAQTTPTLVAWQTAANYRDVGNFIVQLTQDPHFAHHDSLVRVVHFMLTRHDPKASPGLYRTGPVYIWNAASGRRVYDAPRHTEIALRVKELADHLADGAWGSTLVRAAMTHLNLLMIHPFVDGNGRVARTFETLVMSTERNWWPELCGVEEYLGLHTDRYYEAMQTAGGATWTPSSDTRPWIRFVLTAHYHQAHNLASRVRLTHNAWLILESYTQREGLAPHTVPLLCEAAMGAEVNRVSYRSISTVTEQQATHDLGQLSAMGLLTPSSDGNEAFVASDKLRVLSEVTNAQPEWATDPFNS